MDKDRFIRLAPSYYALAIAVYFFDVSSASRRKVIGSYRFRDEFEDKLVYRLKDVALFDKALAILVSNELLDVVSDDFGPEIIIKKIGFDNAWIKLVQSIPEPFSKFERLDDEGVNWLLAALDKLNFTYEELGVTDADFERPEREWEPLPLDRADPNLGEAIGELEDAVTQIEQDNGYAATIPEERSYVLDTLKQTLQKLKKDSQISIAYLRRNAFDPLLTVTKRFAGAAIGVAATGAAAALLKLIESAENTAITQAIRSYFGL